MRTRKRASDLYQVDFVAALFSGFLLVWLATAATTEFSAKSSVPVTAVALIISIDTQTTRTTSISSFNVAVGQIASALSQAMGLGSVTTTTTVTTASSLHVLPSESLSMECLQQEVLDDLLLPHDRWHPCAGRQAVRPTTASMGPQPQVAAPPNPLAHDTVFGMPIKIEGTIGSQSLEVAFIGRAITIPQTSGVASGAAPGVAANNASSPFLSGTDNRSTAIGIVTDAAFEPTSLLVARYSTDSAASDIELYPGSNAGGTYARTPERRYNLSNLQATLIVNPGADQRCYTASTTVFSNLPIPIVKTRC